MAHIAVIGAGYVGAGTAAGFAELGHRVVGVDVDAAKVARLAAGECPIYEPGLEELLARNVRAGRLTFTTEYAAALADAEFVFICVNTPSGAHGGADMAYVRAAARSIGRHLAPGRRTVVINKSTMPIGSGDLVGAILGEESPPGARFAVVANPEFLREGSAVQDMLHPDRVVLGSSDREAMEAVADLYRPLDAPLLLTDLRTAEMIKYASNAFLATRISFINEVAQICEALGADVRQVAAGMGFDKRIGPHFLGAGIGFGGSCFEADETVFALNSPNIAAERLDTLFDKGGRPRRGDVVEFVTPTDQRVLAFDLETGRPALAEVTALTRRPYRGTMVTIRTSMGRSLRVTADHPVILASGDGFEIVPAGTVTPGDRLMALCELPAVEQATHLNLIELLRDTALEGDVYVAATDGAFAEQYRCFAAHIPPEMLKYPWEIKRGNRMPLRLFHHLSALGVLDVGPEQLQLYTAKGAGARIDALLPIDGDFLRLCGYYLAEGYIGRDHGRSGVVRERIGFCFHEDEAEYLGDVRRILERWGLKVAERHSGRATTILVSSRIFAWLLRDVLKCGTHSADKALPRLAFNVPEALRLELVRGAFSGDGAVTSLQGGQNLMFEYATVSSALADGLALLLQTLGVVPALHTRWMNKSKQPAHILRVSGHAQLAQLQDAFGDKHRARIGATLAGYRRLIRAHGYARQGPYAALAVREVACEEVETTVYSLETSTGTLIASSGLICHNCFPKDVQALEYMAAEADCHPQLLRAVLEINRDSRRNFVRKLDRLLDGLEGRVVAVWGLAFKPNTDDLREAPALEIIRDLVARGARVQAYDPAAMEGARAVLGAGESLAFCADPYEAARGADAVALVTEWNEFKGVDLARVRAGMRDPDRPVLVDGRNLYDPRELAALGFTYRAVGVPPAEEIAEQPIPAVENILTDD